jgi:ParB family chromosome partitioning protein
MNNQDKILQNAVFWVEIDKVAPNPYQPRKDFDEQALQDLADSIRQYGVLQPLTVSRKEHEKADGGFLTTYELIAGERRLRASKIAGLKQIPVIIRIGDDDQTKLELAIIENLQREDLNPIDRAKAFNQLASDFNFKHTEIAKKMGKSREYVSNSLRLLALPEEIQEALSKGRISEGHTRPLLMLTDKEDEQMTLFREMLIRKMTVREAENLARKVAQDKVRKKQYVKDPNILEIESDLAQKLGTRVHIEKRDVGGVITIDFFSVEDLETIVEQIKAAQKAGEGSMADKLKNAALAMGIGTTANSTPAVDNSISLNFEKTLEEIKNPQLVEDADPTAHALEKDITQKPEALEEEIQDNPHELIDDRGAAESKQDENTEDDDLYNIKNFVI